MVTFDTIRNTCCDKLSNSVYDNVDKDIHNPNSSYLWAFSKSCMHWTRASTASMGQAL